MCGGVAYLHDHGIVHRDLKPGNIFSDEGTVKIGDYGLAKFISCSRRSGQTESVGTVHYMAPEIANGRYGREIDTYALGIILFEMLTGRVPFEGESVGEVLMKHLTAEPDLSVLARAVSRHRRSALWPRIRTCASRASASWSPCCRAAATVHLPSTRDVDRPRRRRQPNTRLMHRSSDRPLTSPSKLRTEFKHTAEHMADHFAIEEPIAKAMRAGLERRSPALARRTQAATESAAKGCCSSWP